MNTGNNRCLLQLTSPNSQASANNQLGPRASSGSQASSSQASRSEPHASCFNIQASLGSHASSSQASRSHASCTVFSEDVWEEYALGLRADEDCADLEEHLLICSACQDLVAELDEYVQVVKAAALATSSDDPGGLLSADTRSRRSLSKPMKVAVAIAGSVLWLS